MSELRLYLLEKQSGNTFLRMNRRASKQGVLVPKNLEGEDPAWLQVENIRDPETGEVVPTVTLNESEKQRIQDKRLQEQLAEEQAKEERLQAIRDQRQRIRDIDLTTVDTAKLRTAIAELKAIVLEHDKIVNSEANE